MDIIVLPTCQSGFFVVFQEKQYLKSQVTRLLLLLFLGLSKPLINLFKCAMCGALFDMWSMEQGGSKCVEMKYRYPSLNVHMF
jgi:hypothetical protein